MLYSKYGALIWRPLTIIKNKVHTALGRFIELVVIEPSVFRMFLPCLFAMTIFLYIFDRRMKRKRMTGKGT